MSLRELHVSPRAMLFAILSFDVISVCAGFIAALVRGVPVTTYVARTGYMHYLSFAHFLLVAFLALLIFIFRFKQASTEKLTGSYLLWAFITLASILLVIDQLFWFHDNIGTWIVNLLGIQSSIIVNRAGDFVLLLYAIIGLILVTVFKSEFIKYKSAFPFLIAEIPVFLLLVALYTLTTSTDILNVLMTGSDSVTGCYSWF